MKIFYRIERFALAPALLFIIFPFCLHAQGIHLTRGIQWTASGNPSLVLNNAGLINDGSFNAGFGTVLFTGEAATSLSFIGGEQPVAFYNITIGKSLNDVQLNNNIAVGGKITMSSGNLQLTKYMLDLGDSGSINGERNESRIAGAEGGVIKIMALLNKPALANPGNIGVELTGNANLGPTLITRGHIVQTNSDGQAGIQRYFDIVPALNTNLQINLRFFYLDAELAGNNKEDLALFSNTGDGSRWKSLGRDQSNTNAGWVVKANIDQLGRITLARAGNKEGVTTGTKAFIHAYPNPFHDVFTIQLFTDREREGVIYFEDARGHVLATKKVRYMAGLNTVEWTTAPYAKGLYYVVFDDPAVGTIPIMKL